MCNLANFLAFQIFYSFFLFFKLRGLVSCFDKFCSILGFFLLVFFITFSSCEKKILMSNCASLILFMCLIIG